MNVESFVLAAATADLDDEPRARDHADAVEFRMDLAEDPRFALSNYEGELPLIATNRSKGQGGEADDDQTRLDALRDAAEHPAVEAVDIELEALESGDAVAVAEHAREHGAIVIASTHDFEGTPDRDAMVDVLSRAGEAGDVAKLAVTANDRGDVLDMLGVTHERDAAGETVATMAMGEAGGHSRAVAPLYGSRIGYAPVDPARATAPGQYDLATLRSLIDRLRSDRSNRGRPGSRS